MCLCSGSVDIFKSGRSSLQPHERAPPARVSSVLVAPGSCQHLRLSVLLVFDLPVSLDLLFRWSICSERSPVFLWRWVSLSHTFVGILDISAALPVLNVRVASASSPLRLDLRLFRSRLLMRSLLFCVPHIVLPGQCVLFAYQ